MQYVSIYYLVSVLLVSALAIILVWSWRSLGIRVLSVTALAAIALIGYAALQSLLGNPKPLSESELDFPGKEETSVVIAASVDEGNAVYLWIRHGSLPQPYYYRMDWNDNTAAELEKMLKDSVDDNTEVAIKNNFEDSLDSGKDPLFYTLPRESMPFKPPPVFQDYKTPVQQ